MQRALAHPALERHVAECALEDRAKAAAARRSLRRRVTSGQRLSLPELIAVKRHLSTGLSSDERLVVTRSMRRTILQIGGAIAVALSVFLFVFMDLRRSYTLGLEPAGSGAAHRRSLVAAMQQIADRLKKTRHVRVRGEILPRKTLPAFYQK